MEHDQLVEVALSAASAAQEEDGGFELPIIVSLVVVFGILAGIYSFVAQQLPTGTRDTVRRAGWIVLHLADYATNLLLMYVLFVTDRQVYLFVLVPTHLVIGFMCMYCALHCKWQEWPCPNVLNLLFAVVVLGLMQGMQIFQVFNEYQATRSNGDLDEELDAEDPDSREAQKVPQTARYHLKAFDGVMEAFIFAGVSLLVLLQRNWANGINSSQGPLEPWQAYVLYLTAFTCFLSSGLSLMETDVRTSQSMQQVIDSASFYRVLHLAFRSSEVALRILVILTLITYTSQAGFFWAGILAIVADYVLGVALLLIFGGRDAMQPAALILGLPFLAANVVQFLDAPGMSLPAKQISRIIVPVRLVEVAAVVALVVMDSEQRVEVVSPAGEQRTLIDEFRSHTEWLSLGIFALVLYLALLIGYALIMKGSADLHGAVVSGDVDTLTRLLAGTNHVLDVDRYGPDGRTPLHLAAQRGKAECAKVLIENGANILARSSDPVRNTALHVAAANQRPDVVSVLVFAKKADAEFINAKNEDGDTAVHIAAKRQNVAVLQELLRHPKVDLTITNKKGNTAAECAPSQNFGYERDSAESIIAELFREAELGAGVGAMASITSRGPNASVEMSRLQGGTGSTEVMKVSSELTVGDHPDQHKVEVVRLDSAMERQLEQKLGRKRTPGQSEIMEEDPEEDQDAKELANVHLSVFMLSAGLGALSSAYKRKMREELSMREQPTAGSGKSEEVGTSLVDFEEIKPVGEGAFGKVVMVKHKETGEIFAMKLMDKAKFKAHKITRKAHSEQFILKTTRHPFIVSLHYAFQGSTFWALVMDFCPNGDLQKLLVDYGTPGMAHVETARYCAEVLLAIEHLHKLRVIFRDLKLENVVIDTEWRSRVTDFGLAKKLQTEADAKTMCGSYGYAAPEIMANTGKYTYAVDLYSFGVMIYMMVSGGEESPKKKTRLPPVKHNSLQKKLREAQKTESGWAAPSIGALELMLMLTAGEPATRTTSTAVKEHKFFQIHLGRPIDALLTEGPFKPPASPPSK